MLTSLPPACASADFEEACPPLASYPPGFAERLALEVERLPPGSAAFEALSDYVVLRAALSACEGARPRD